MTEIAFIGLGNMGSGMCANLCARGFSVTAFDIAPQAVEKAVEKGAKAAQTAHEAAEGAEVVVTMLPAGSHVLDVYFDTGRIARSAAEGARCE